MKKVACLCIISCALLFATLGSQAQPLTSEDIKASMVSEWERAKLYTIDYLNTMPANKYLFKVVDSIPRSFANQYLHLAVANVFLMMSATDGAPTPWLSQQLQDRASAQNKDSVMYYVVASYDYCINAVKNSDVNKWGEKKKIFNYEVTRFALMNKTFEHQTHHRGQTTTYIRLQNIRPPQERLF